MEEQIEISEREFKIIQEIANNHHPSQRSIAQKLGISLGLTNLLIKKLSRKGYLKIDQLNRRNVQYILTPPGLKEKARKSYSYTLKAIDSLRQMKNDIQHLILKEYKRGRREFAILGSGEVADLTEIALRNLGLSEIIYYRIKGKRGGIRADHYLVGRSG